MYFYIIYPSPKNNHLRVEQIEFSERAVTRVRSLIENGVNEEDILVANEYDFNEGDTFLNRWGRD